VLPVVTVLFRFIELVPGARHCLAPRQTLSPPPVDGIRSKRSHVSCASACRRASASSRAFWFRFLARRSAFCDASLLPRSAGRMRRTRRLTRPPPPRRRETRDSSEHTRRCRIARHQRPSSFSSRPPAGASNGSPRRKPSEIAAARADGVRAAALFSDISDRSFRPADGRLERTYRDRLDAKHLLHRVHRVAARNGAGPSGTQEGSLQRGG